MNSFSECNCGPRRRRQSSAATDTRERELVDNSHFYTRFFPINMQKTTRISLIGIFILVIAAIVILLLNLENIKSASIIDEQCVKLDGSASCHFTDSNPYRYYGTKTAYSVVLNNNINNDLPVGQCRAKVFYLLSRHATRYPDEEIIVDINKKLPVIKEKIMLSSQNGKAKLCKNDIEKLKQWAINMEPEDDNRLSATGEVEAEKLALRLKERFSSILNQNYSPEKFLFEYTSRARTRSTAEAFGKGLFGDKYKQINFEDKDNDDVLTFHKSCKKLKKKCDDPTFDVSEIDKFENGPLMEQVVESISNRVGFNISNDEVELIRLACVFGYALNKSDAWCSLLSTDELQVLEFGDDIDDYYKDAYGNKINYEQACPAVKFIADLFDANQNSTDPKVVLHFSHAGGIKKVYSLFGLFRDESPLVADGFCTQKNRKWRSSKISPFTSNIAFVLYQCEDDLKVAVFHNEQPVLVDGCSELLCPYQQFSAFYSPIAQHCNLNAICCKCCKRRN